MKVNRYRPLRNLRAEMARNGISTAEVADAVGVSPATVRQWLNGTNAPSVYHAAAIVSAFFDDLSIEYLFIE